MKRIRGFVVAVGVLLAAGCATVDISSGWNPDFEASDYRTWDYITGDEVPSLAAVTVIQVEVGRKLTELGLQQKAGTPDLLLAVHAVTSEANRSEHFSWYESEPGSSDWWWQGGGVRMRDITVGSVVVDLVDREENALVWRGVGSGVVSDTAEPEERIAKIQAAVDRMFAKFPSR